jgi:hypothetical protein
MNATLGILCGAVAATIAMPSLPAAIAVAALAGVVIFDRYADATALRRATDAAKSYADEVKALHASIAKHHDDIEKIVDRHGMRR